MPSIDYLEHLVSGVTSAQQHWQTRRRAEFTSTQTAFTIAVARETGAQGAAVAREVGRRLGWPVYDHELLERIAEEHNLRVSLLESLDERRQSWLTESMAGFALNANMGESGYVHHLIQTLLSLGAHGDCVIVGRGAAQLLPPAVTLRVRLMAPFEDRAAQVMRQRGLSKPEAVRFVEGTDREHVAFVKDHFLKDPTDPHNYDLVLNVSRWSVMGCADLIVDGLGRLTNGATHAET